MECELGIQFETIDVVDKLKAGSGSLDLTKSLRGIKICTGSLKLSLSKSPGSHFSHAGLNCSPLMYLGMKLKIGLAQMLHKVEVSMDIVELRDWGRGYLIWFKGLAAC